MDDTTQVQAHRVVILCIQRGLLIAIFSVCGKSPVIGSDTDTVEPLYIGL